mmetsp:Transcript_28529/g.55517  ORF Transcript_28529/g.55517 Transcript_28529/m.55517 type:complete len:200 (-) Transcript_28529:180-779(-)
MGPEPTQVSGGYALLQHLLGLRELGRQGGGEGVDRAEDVAPLALELTVELPRRSAPEVLQGFWRGWTNQGDDQRSLREVHRASLEGGEGLGLVSLRFHRLDVLPFRALKLESQPLGHLHQRLREGVRLEVVSPVRIERQKYHGEPLRRLEHRRQLVLQQHQHHRRRLKPPVHVWERSLEVRRDGLEGLPVLLHGREHGR